MPDINDTIPEDCFVCAVPQGDGKKIVDPGLVAKLLYDLIEKGCLNMIEELVKLDNNVNLKFENGAVPLHVAAIFGREEVAKLLISYEADVNAQDGNGNTPIYHATKNGDLEMTELLLINGADVRDYPELLNNAVENDHIKLVEILLQHGVDVNCRDIFGGTTLLTAARDKNMLEDYVDPEHGNARGEIAKLLLSWGANVNAQTQSGYTALESAIESGYVKVVEALLEYKAEVNPASLNASARTGIAVITEMLLNSGADVNATLLHGMTALHIASLEGHLEVMEVLLRGGAKVNLKTDIMRMTPLHFAAMHLIRSPLPSSIAKLLLNFGADVDCRDKSGRTALHIASQNGRTEIIIDLLNHGSDINITNKESRTPLFCAGVDCFSRRLLVSYGHEDSFVGSGRIYAWEVTIEILKRHIIKLKTAKLYVTEENLQSIGSSHVVDDFQDECEKELAEMKNQKINNTTISYYNILTRDINQLALIARNENVMQAFGLGDLKIKFPKYYNLIESNIRRGKIRKELLEQNNEFFHILMNSIPGLPYNCVENIFSYLENDDLRILAEVCTSRVGTTNISSYNNI